MTKLTYQQVELQLEKLLDANIGLHKARNSDNHFARLNRQREYDEQLVRTLSMLKELTAWPC